jgi:hypothetical protein
MANGLFRQVVTIWIRQNRRTRGYPRLSFTPL